MVIMLFRSAPLNFGKIFQSIENVVEILHLLRAALKRIFLSTILICSFALVFF